MSESAAPCPKPAGLTLAFHIHGGRESFDSLPPQAEVREDELEDHNQFERGLDVHRPGGRAGPERARWS